VLIVLPPDPGGGMGNQLFRLNHAILYARLREATLVVPRPMAFDTLHRRAWTFDFSTGRRSFDPERIEVLDTFIHGNEATRMLSFRLRYFNMQEHVKPLFAPDAPHERLGEDTLAIHVRAGDIFEPGGSNPKYGQPPLSWYQHLIERSGYSEVVVVVQTEFPLGGPNPVVAEIEKRWPHVRIVSRDTEHDFHTLRHARHLALSGGTFAVTAAMTNTRLARLHVPRYRQGEDPNFSHVFPPGEDLGFARVDHEIRRYEGIFPWRNQPEQIRLMLSHPIDDLGESEEFQLRDARRSDMLRGSASDEPRER